MLGDCGCDSLGGIEMTKSEFYENAGRIGMPEKYDMEVSELMGLMHIVEFDSVKKDVTEALYNAYKLGFDRGMEYARQRGECHE